jgi:putative DNA primase/helicase
VASGAQSSKFATEIARVKAATQLSSVIGRTIKLEKKGKEYVACCPFHEESTPSFKVNDTKRIYHCFGCSVQGDVYDWLEKKQGLSIAEAVEYLGGEAPQHVNGKDEDEGEAWQPLVPPPDDAPRPYLLGFDHVYAYLDSDGVPLFYVRRRDAKGETKKRFVPLTFGVLNGKRGWHSRHPAAPRPLYGLDRLAALLGAAVLICEGEKATDAARRMFPDRVCMCWPAGTANVKNADWSPLIDRSVAVWPDNDTGGHKAAAEIKDRLPQAVVIRVADLPPKADAADVALEDPETWLVERIAEATRKKKANGHDPHPLPIEDHGRPTVRVLNGLRHRAADQGLEAMFKAGVPFYQRDKQLVRAALVKAKSADGRIIEVPGIIPVTNPILARALGQSAEWERVKADGEPVRIDPPKEVVEQIGAMVGDWPFPPLSGVIGTPTLRPDGSILSAPGYDDATGLVLLSPPPMEPVKMEPSWREAEQALTRLNDLLVEFPFADEASRSVAISMILTVVLRGALIPAVPMHVVTAPQPGSGKSYLLDTAAAIATGERCPVMAFSADPAETEKRLVGAALAGFPIIALDNVNDMLTGDFLAQATERPILLVRPLGGSQVVRIANTFSVFANGNNIQATADLVRRTLRCGLDANVENPEERTFFSDPVATVLADRGKYIHSCLTIARAYLAAGAPQQTSRLPSFPSWSDIVRGSLVWLKWPDPVDSMALVRGEDPTRAARAALFETWAKDLGLNPAGLLTAGLVEESEARDEHGFLHPSFRDACLVVASERNGSTVSPRRLGNYLRSCNNNRVGDLKLVVNRQDAARPRWVLMRV